MIHTQAYQKHRVKTDAFWGVFFFLLFNFCFLFCFVFLFFCFFAYLSFYFYSYFLFFCFCFCFVFFFVLVFFFFGNCKCSYMLFVFMVEFFFRKFMLSPEVSITSGSYLAGESPILFLVLNHSCEITDCRFSPFCKLLFSVRLSSDQPNVPYKKKWSICLLLLERKSFVLFFVCVFFFCFFIVYQYYTELRYLCA